MTTDARTSLGRLGEQLAADHFERLGWRILARNHHTRFGELDLVAVDGDVLVFCEVKTVRLGRGMPWDSLHAQSARRCAGSRASGSARCTRARSSTSCASTRSAWSRRRGQLVRLDHLEGAF